MARPAELLIIDAQNDFCDLPEAWCPIDPLTGTRLAPALPVPGAHADLLRLAGFIGGAAALIDGITVTLDSHHRHDIAHPGYWRTGDGAAVAPFTTITAPQLRAGAFRPALAAEQERSQRYLDALEAAGRYTLMCWPVHCQLGSWGHGLHAAVLSACNAWEDARHSPVRVVGKGSFPWSEHYSALMAEVPDPADPGTALNRPLLDRLDRAATILIAGEASSHCVKATVEHLVEYLPSGRLGRLWLLTDCMSPVAGFEPQAAAFIDAMRGRGLPTLTHGQAAARLRQEAG
ncbi:MAG: cysteine hydrolase [Burkholderiaceae bacterium]|nr:cysteine hydrolase [Burkholderiaceae bacterium]